MRDNRRIGKRGEQKRRWDNENKRPCSDCGKLIFRNSTCCIDCTYVRQRARYPVIQSMWMAGASRAAIAGALDTTENVIGFTMVQMRKQGWDLPYRWKRRV